MKRVTMAVLALALLTVPPALAGEKKGPEPYKYGPDAKVVLGAEGKLVYTPDKRGNQIPDFSRCGYMGGGVKLPDVPVVKTLTPSAGEEDDAAYVQKAIDEVCALPLKESGFRGALLLKKGTYRIKTGVKIHASGVVVRGEGQHEDGTIILGTRREEQGGTLLSAGAELKITEIKNSRREIADSYVPWGVKSFTLKSTEGLSVGDKIIVNRPASIEWSTAIGLKGAHMVRNEWKSYDFRFQRQIVAIDGNRITLDAPTVQPMENKFGGGFVYRYKAEGGLTQVGIESMRFVSQPQKGLPGRGDPGRPRNAVSMANCVNSWIRNITAVHFVKSAVVLAGTRPYGCRFVTVQDCAYVRPLGAWGGGWRYAFAHYIGGFCLFQRCFASRGSRHSFQVGSRSHGPNVFLDCVNDGQDSGPHHRWAMGCLYDNINGGDHICPDRRRWGAQGWAGAQIVFWNGVGGKAEGTQQPTARNYFFGMKVKKGAGKAEAHVQPRSLYLQQLEERLGKEAVENVTTEGQRKATTEKKSRENLIWGPIRSLSK